jgi:hypothetical protein
MKRIIEKADLRVTDVQDGDIVHAEFRGHPFSGVAWYDTEFSDLMVGSTRLGRHETVIRKIEREVPLPTELGSVILDVVTDTERKLQARMGIKIGSVSWLLLNCSSTDGNAPDSSSVSARRIVSWASAKVVPA